MTQAPAGWKFDRASNGDSITISGPGCICCIVVAYPSDPRVIPESVLYALVSDLIAAAPHTAAPAADRAVSELSAAIDRFQSACVDEGAATMRQARDELEAAIRAQAAPPADRAELATRLREAISTHIDSCVFRRQFALRTRRALDAAIDALARSTDAPSDFRGMVRDAVRYVLGNMQAIDDASAEQAVANIDGVLGILLDCPPAAATSTPCASGEGEAQP